MSSPALVTVPDYAALDARLVAIAQEALPLSHLEPLSTIEESERVARDPKYNPVFKYARQPDHLRRLVDELERLHIAPDGVGQFFQSARDYLQTRLRLRIHLGDNAHWREPIYPLPPERVFNLA